MTRTLDGVGLTDFIDGWLRADDNRSVPEYIATKLVALDPDEVFIHVEFPNAENELGVPRLWRIDAWRTSYAKYLRTKEYSAKERHVYVVAAEKRAIIVRKWAAQTGMTEEQASKLAIALIKTRNESMCRALFGTNLADLIQADQEFEEYKNKIGKK